MKNISIFEEETSEQRLQAAEDKLVNKVLKLIQEGKSRSEIMHILEIDREIDNSIDLNYLPKVVTTREELEAALNGKSFILKRQTPPSVLARVEQARNTGALDHLYKIDPRNLTEEDKQTINLTLGTYIEQKEYMPFIDYQIPVRELKPDLEPQDFYKAFIYTDDATILFEFGIEIGLIRTFPQDLIEAARKVEDSEENDGIPFSFKLLIDDFTATQCVFYSWLIEELLRKNGHNVKREKGTIDYIYLNPPEIEKYYHNDFQREMYGVHYYVIETMEDGTEWVYDSADHAMIEKNLYYAMNRVRFTKTIKPEEQEPAEEDERELTEEETKERYKKLVIFLSKEDEYVEYAACPEQLQAEFAYFKNAINYEELIDKLDLRAEIEALKPKKLTL